MKVTVWGCRALMERIPVEPSPYFNLKILYVPQGFESIDEGVVKGLGRIVRECIVVTPEQVVEVAPQRKAGYHSGDERLARISGGVSPFDESAPEPRLPDGHLVCR